MLYNLQEQPLTATPMATAPQEDAPVAMDFGSHTIKLGYTNSKPFVFPNLVSRYRDNKYTNKTLTFVGSDTSLDPQVRYQAKSPFDGALITNWDYVESIVDYSMSHLSRENMPPLVITEKLATVSSQRRMWNELLFETYDTEKVCYGVDSLFSWYANGARDGLVIGMGHEDTHVVPVVGGRAVLEDSKRIEWGGNKAANYLSKLMALKYPFFPTKLSAWQYETLFHDQCFVARNYASELTLDLDTIRDAVIQMPYKDVSGPTKTEEEIAAQQARRKESGKRLQEQARIRREQKLQQKEQEYVYYSELQQKMEDMSRKAQLSALQNAGFEDMDDFKKYYANLEVALNKREEVPDSERFDLLDKPDESLNPQELKEKRKQKLLKANLDARDKARAEKEQAEALKQQEIQQDIEWRTNDLAGWVRDKRDKLSRMVKARQERIKRQQEVKDRKSQAAKQRMKIVASLADESAGNKRNRRPATIDNDPNDTFGTNDDDWAVYRDPDEEVDDEEEYDKIVDLEKVLLEYDETFTQEDTLDAQYDWRKSTLHLFYRGAEPFNSEDIREQHQLHMNVERIRVPEVFFQPSIAGVDQAGISEVCEGLMKKYNLNEVLLTGGVTQLPGLRDRIVTDFTSFLPVGTAFNVRNAQDPVLDTWNGMAKYARESDDSIYMTRALYNEYGADYIVKHQLGNTDIYR